MDWENLIYVLVGIIGSLLGIFVPIYLMVRDTKSQVEVNQTQWVGEKNLLTGIITQQAKELEELKKYAYKKGDNLNRLKIKLAESGFKNEEE